MPAHVHVTTCLRGDGKQPINDFCSCYHCTLSVCSVCSCYEGSLTTDCPGVPISSDLQDAIYKTQLDYTDDGLWHQNPGPRHPHFRAIPARGQSVREITLANYQPGENHD